MAELEQSLRALAAEVEWPATPDLAERLELAPRRRGRRSLVLVALAAALAIAVAVALAVPSARSSILRFLHLGGVSIERVSTLPPATERPLAADLGRPVTPAEARIVLGAPFLLPDTAGRPLLREQAGIVSTLLATPEPVLLMETRFTGLMKKLAMSSTKLESVAIGPDLEGVWLAGPGHVFYGPELPPRLAGNVLLWESGGITYRLEGRTLAKQRALELARQTMG